MKKLNSDNEFVASNTTSMSKKSRRKEGSYDDKDCETFYEYYQETKYHTQLNNELSKYNEEQCENKCFFGIFGPYK